MHQIAEKTCRILLSFINKGVILFRRKCIGFLHPDAKNILQSARIASESNQIVILYITAEIGRKEAAALLYIFAYLLIESVLAHIKHRCHHQLIGRKIILHTDKIHGNILLEECPVIEAYFLRIINQLTRTCT